jgi:hypothetical protein
MGVMMTPALTSETHSESTAAAKVAGFMLTDRGFDRLSGL